MTTSFESSVCSRINKQIPLSGTKYHSVTLTRASWTEVADILSLHSVPVKKCESLQTRMALEPSRDRQIWCCSCFTERVLWRSQTITPKSSSQEEIPQYSWCRYGWAYAIYVSNILELKMTLYKLCLQIYKYANQKKNMCVASWKLSQIMGTVQEFDGTCQWLPICTACNMQPWICEAPL